MMESISAAWLWLVGLFLAVLGWIGITQIDRVNDHAKRLILLEQHDSSQYTEITNMKDDVKEIKDDVKSLLRRPI